MRIYDFAIYTEPGRAAAALGASAHGSVPHLPAPAAFAASHAHGMNARAAPQAPLAGAAFSDAGAGWRSIFGGAPPARPWAAGATGAPSPVAGAAGSLCSAPAGALAAVPAGAAQHPHAHGPAPTARHPGCGLRALAAHPDVPLSLVVRASRNLPISLVAKEYESVLRRRLQRLGELRALC